MEAPLEQTEHGLVATGPGWFLVNAREVRWLQTGGARIANLAGDTRFEQVGIGIEVLGPGEPMAVYHREWDQEGFLVLDGAGIVVLEGEEHPLRRWDYVHCPPGVAHVIVGGPIVVLALGARTNDRTEYVDDPVAARHGAAPRSADDPYEGWERPTPTRYGGWLD